jgi:hypothetical protein
LKTYLRFIEDLLDFLFDLWQFEVKRIQEAALEQAKPLLEAKRVVIIINVRTAGFSKDIPCFSSSRRNTRCNQTLAKKGERC